MARKEIKTAEVWYSDSGCEACGELDALVEDFDDARGEASRVGTAGQDLPLTGKLIAAIQALHAFVERSETPAKPKKKASRKKKLKLEVGKSCAREDGTVWSIVRKVSGEFPFVDHRGNTYKSDGSWAFDGKHPLDLVREA